MTPDLSPAEIAEAQRLVDFWLNVSDTILTSDDHMKRLARYARLLEPSGSDTAELEQLRREYDAIAKLVNHGASSRPLFLSVQRFIDNAKHSARVEVLEEAAREVKSAGGVSTKFHARRIRALAAKEKA